ncbi:MAG: beta-class carbonic anhydrase [Acidimicrobiia bacterium]
MSELEPLFSRNEQFAESFEGRDLPIKSRFPLVVVSCVDPRTSPVHFLNLEIGDAYVMRTVGGRVTDAVEAELAILAFLQERNSGSPAALNAMIIHHTDCGMQKISSAEARAALTQFMGTGRLAEVYPAPDPEESVRFDVERLRSSPTVPSGITVTGHVYDVKTGRLNQIVA